MPCSGSHHLARCWPSHPIPSHAFLSRRFTISSSASVSFSADASVRSFLTSDEVKKTGFRGVRYRCALLRVSLTVPASSSRFHAGLEGADYIICTDCKLGMQLANVGDLRESVVLRYAQWCKVCNGFPAKPLINIHKLLPCHTHNDGVPCSNQGIATIFGLLRVAIAALDSGRAAQDKPLPYPLVLFASLHRNPPCTHDARDGQKFQ